jgi:glycerophosphoryl diester phosphodiesterase
VLELCAAERAGVLVELKSPHLYPGLVEKVVALAGEVRGADNIWCISFDHPTIWRMRGLDAALPLGYLFMPQVKSFAVSDETVQAVLPFYLTAAQCPEQIEQAHRLGKQVFVWTVNDGAAMRHMAELGVNGIASDHPSLLLHVFRGVQSE